MTLRSKTILITLATLLALIGVIAISARSVLHRGFGWVETEDARRNTIRAMNALDREITAVDLITHDWGSWDEVYRFMRDRNQKFVGTYLFLDGFVTIDINHIVFIDTEGKIKFARGFDLESGRPLSLPDSVASIIARKEPIVRQTEIGKHTAGLLMLPEGPMLFGTRPIITTQEKGPVRGTLFFGRYLNARELGDIETVTQLPVRIVPWNKLSGDFLAAAKALSGPDSVNVRPIDGKTIAGYARITDVYGKPALILRVTMPRDILAQENRVQKYLIWAILIVGIAVTAVMFAFLESAVLSRLKRLSSDFAAIGQRGDFMGRITAEGGDELAGVATAGNRMLDALEESHNRIHRRNREMRTIMDTVSVGLLSLDRDFQVSGEYSESAVAIFGENIAGKNYITLLGLDEEGESTLRDYLELVLEGNLPTADLVRLNPFPELPLARPDGGIRWVRIDYWLMHSNEERNGVVLVQAEDITEGKDLAEQAAQAEADAEQIVAAAENPDIFREFLSQSTELSFALRKGSLALREGYVTPELVNELFRDAHTLKGTASAFGAQSLSHAAGEMEDCLAAIRNGEEVDDMNALALEYFENLIDTDLEMVREKTARIYGGFMEEDEMWLHIPLRDVDLLLEEARSFIANGDSGAELFNRIQSLRMVPAARGLARATRIIEDLIRRTGGRAMFRIKGGDIPIDCEMARDMNAPLVHLFRNSLAHGFESVSERIVLGKPNQGTATLSVRKEDGGTVFDFSDDGRGIDPEQIRNRAVESGLLSPDTAEQLTVQECINLIFRPGFSTTETVSGLSGRGVGLDAVSTDIRKLNGTIRVELASSGGVRFVIFIPDRVNIISG